MTKYARLTEADPAGDRTVIETIEAADAATLATMFHPDIAAQFIQVPAAAVQHSTKNGATWTHPAPASPVPPARRTLVTRTEYYGLFTPPEEAMIRIVAREEVTPALLAAADAAEKQRLMAVASLQVMLSRTDALPAANTIDLANHQVGQGLDLLVTMNLLTAARRAEIVLGI